MELTLVVVALMGLLLGRLAAGWSAVMLRDWYSGGLLNCLNCQTPVVPFDRWVRPLPIRCNCGTRTVWWHMGSAVGLSLLFTAFTWLMLSMDCQGLEEVRPALSNVYARLPFHLFLIFLLWTATVTDLLDYMIPDPIVVTGIVVAVIAATATGDLQMIHIWVNWDNVIPGVQGPYLPQWMKDHQHLHGLAWSLSGLLCGSAFTWVVRHLSGWMLGYPALGSGDVTLMAMVGAFIGWQPVLCSLALATIAGLVVGLLVRVFQGKSFVAFGPYLAVSTVVVISTWRWIWADYFRMRIIFSHWPSVVGLVGAALGSLFILLLGLRLFRSIPVETRRSKSDGQAAE